MNFFNWIRPSLGQLGTYAPKKLQLKQIVKKNLLNYELPKISVVIPSYNQAQFIRDTLNSLLEEQYNNLELIVIDGGSKDGSVEIIKEYDAYISYWVSEPDGGQAAAINKGFQKATGSIMAWLNSDDRIVPGALHLIADYFQNHPEIDIIYGNRILINEQGQEIGRWVLPGHSSKVLKCADFIPQETLYWRRRAWESVGSQLDERFQFALDWDLLLRFLKANLKFHHLPEFIGLFRVHQAQKTLSMMDLVGQNEINSLRTRELGYLPTKNQITVRIAFYLLHAKFRECFTLK